MMRADSARHGQQAGMRMAPVAVMAQALRFGPPGRLLWDGASHAWPEGLCLVCGGEGSGKTSLLKALAGQLPLQGGSLQFPQFPQFPQRPALFWRDPRAELPACERERTAQDWMQEQRRRHPGWDDAAWQAHVQGLGLEPHLHKPLLALSTGSLRKLWMAAGWASGAALLLIDEPLAALDRGSMDHVQRTLAGMNRAGQGRQDRPLRCVIVAHWDRMEGVDWDDVLELPEQGPLR